jgi:hypothetical protein
MQTHEMYDNRIGLRLESTVQMHVNWMVQIDVKFNANYTKCMIILLDCD